MPQGLGVEEEPAPESAARRPRGLRRAAATAAATAAIAVGCADTLPPEVDPADAVRLVVVVVVDQLRPDRLSESMPGGLGRFVRDGRAWVDASVEHAFTETCPGHAVMLTGRHPARLGIPSNGWIETEGLEKRYCVQDDAPDARIVGLASGAESDPSDGRSPRVLNASALGDWMKSQRPETRVFAISGKDRAAITLGGLQPDGVYWLARGADPAWVTSAYYRETLPAWVAAWDAGAAIAALPAGWRYLPEVGRDAAKGPRPDDYPHESALFSRTQPHPLVADPPNLEMLPDRARHASERMYVTPFADQLSLAFAESLVEAEQLGRGDGADLLALGLSATDVIGHFYGPESWESQDALVRLDRDLGDFFEFLDRTLGSERWMAVLTADHGVLPIPEWIQETGRSQCPVKGGRIDPDRLAASLRARLDAVFPEASRRGARWFRSRGGRFTFDRERLAGDDKLAKRVLAVSSTFLESQSGIARVWNQQEVLAGEGPQPLSTYYRNAWVPGRTGDLVVQVAEDCLLYGRRLATSHGSPYAYDRDVPLIFMGPAIEAGKIFEREASLVDIAPTLADYLDILAPVGLDGRVLPLEVRPPGAAGRRTEP